MSAEDDWVGRLSRLRDLTNVERGRLLPSLLDLEPAQRKIYFLPTFSDTSVAAALKQKFLSATTHAGMFSFFLRSSYYSWLQV
jgi:hypothetical protein